MNKITPDYCESNTRNIISICFLNSSKADNIPKTNKNSSISVFIWIYKIFWIHIVFSKLSIFCILFFYFLSFELIRYSFIFFSLSIITPERVLVVSLNSEWNCISNYYIEFNITKPLIFTSIKAIFLGEYLYLILHIGVVLGGDDNVNISVF